MTFITLVALIVVAALLWQRVEQLRQRVGELERAAAWRDQVVEAVPTEGRPTTRSEQAETEVTEPPLVLTPFGKGHPDGRNRGSTRAIIHSP